MFYYYGAKNQILKYYPQPEKDLIIEPFAGSASYAVYYLNKYKNKHAILIEKDERVFNIWKFLLNASVQEIENYPVPEIGEQTSDFLVMTCSVSNASSKCNSMKFTPRIQKVFEIQKKRIIKFLQVSKRIEVILGDYSLAENINATWFIDPPYQVTKYVNKNNVFPNGNGYSRKCNSDRLDYSNISEFCKSRIGQVIVCEKDGADWLPFSHLHRNKTSLNKNYNEVVWYNQLFGS